MGEVKKERKSPRLVEQKKKVFCVYYESTLCVLCICLVLGRFGIVGLVDSTVASLRTWRICWCCFCYCTRKEVGGGREEEWTGWLAGWLAMTWLLQKTKKTKKAARLWCRGSRLFSSSSSSFFFPFISALLNHHPSGPSFFTNSSSRSSSSC